MTVAPHPAQQGASHVYRAMRDVVQTMDDTLPGKFEITKEGIVHDMMSPGGAHEVTAAHVSRRLERVMPDELLAHTGTPDVEDESEGVLRRPDVTVIAGSTVRSFRRRDGRTLAVRRTGGHRCRSSIRGGGPARHGPAQNLMLPIIPAMFVVSSLMVGATVDEAR
jgi:hypothetical protein